MCALPLDVCREIFLRSSAESLIRFRVVCKGWRAAIDDPSFVKTHTDQQLSSTTILIRSSTGHPFYPLYSVDLQTLTFADGLQSLPAAPLNITREGLSRLPRSPAATCNGLMLIPPPSDEERNWEIWNILTHERLHLPPLDYSVDRWSANGLGYDCETDDYKAVVIVSQESKQPVYETHVYSLRSDKWKIIANFPYSDRDLASFHGVFLGRALYWMTWKGIVALDMKTESYSQLDLPPLHKRDCDDMIFRNFGIYELGGCLMLSDSGKDDYCYYHFDLWVMKDCGKWMKLFALTTGHYEPAPSLRPVAYMKNMMRVFLQDHRSLYLFDVGSDCRKTVSIHGLSGIYTQAFHGSIFRLHANCGRVNGGGSFSKEKKIKMTDIETELIFCLRGDYTWFEPHYGCFSVDSNWYYSSTEEEEDAEED